MARATTRRTATGRRRAADHISPAERKACLDGLRAATAEGLIAARLLQSRRPGVYLEALRIWGDIRSARAAAGLENPAGKPVTWTKEAVLLELRRLAADGVRMTGRDLFLAGHANLVTSAASRFGTFTKARDAAGIEAPPRAKRKNMQRWTVDKVVRAIRKRRRDGETLAPASVPTALYSAAKLYLGTWRAAMEAAGIDYRRSADSPRWRDDELKQWIRANAARYPHYSLSEVRALKGAAAVIQRWGSLPKGALAAGVAGWPVARYEKIKTKRDLIALLRAEAADGLPHPSTRARYHALKIFGDLASAKRAAGVFQR